MLPVILTLCVAGADAAPKRSLADRFPAEFAPVTDVPGLPRVLLIGDSISIGYTVPTRELLKGVANVHRIPENGGPTHTARAKLDAWLGDGKWDAIHFNWGLHDVRLMKGGEHQVSLADYEANLRAMVKRLKATGAKLVWATSTPVPEGAVGRKAGDEVSYNEVALKVMKENGVAVNDLYGFAKGRLAGIQMPQNVHFTKAGSAELAKPVAEAIRKQLGS